MTRILLVEDNPGDARLLRVSIPPEFQLTHVERLDDALRELRTGAHDVVLLDLSLPDSHGLDTCQRVCAASPDTPVIVLTGLADDQIAVQAVREGAQDWLVKGRTEGELVVRAIRYAIERNRLHTRLRELDRVRRLFLSVVTHDLKSPAASILAGIDLLLGERLGPLTADQRHVLELAARTAHRQARLIRDLLDVAVIEAGAMIVHPADHPLRPLVEGVIDELGAVIGARGLTVVNAVDAAERVHGDADRIAQALANLLSNAVKFASHQIRVTAVRTGAGLELAVEDDGPGIAPEVSEHLFDRFVRTDAAGGGAGLGLWIVRGIADAHGGSVRAERGAPGARLVLVLP